MGNERTLIILDLDHTLVYGSYEPLESALLLFEYSAYLRVYERPFAREFIKHCQSLGDVVVYTSARKDYAVKICETLDIRPVELLTRKDCRFKIGMYYKSVKKKWLNLYVRIIIVDDSPNAWKIRKNKSIKFTIMGEFRGK
jgi:TFIIF-interacting CTD phosphatase-like protein